MRDGRTIVKLVNQVVEGSAFQKSTALDSISELGREDPSVTFTDHTLIESALNLLESPDASLVLKSTRALAIIGRSEEARKQIAELDGASKLVRLRQGTEDGKVSSDLGTAILEALQVLAKDESFRLTFRNADGLDLVINTFGSSESQEELTAAARLLGDLSGSEASRNAVREKGGLKQLLAVLKRDETSTELAAAILLTLTVLAAESHANTEHIRQANGLSSIVNYLDPRISSETANAAVTCLTALSLGNQNVKDEVRDLWAIPLLVSLLDKTQGELVEKTVDCMRILTTGNERNKLALFSIPAGVKRLVNIMVANLPSAAITERAAAVVGNLSSTEQFFGAIRECGGLQRLVSLLESGPDSKVTEIAAKTLANMAGNENNNKGILLAGGRPALINLLTQRPSAEVILVVEEALRRMRVTDVERKVTLETLNYCHVQQQQSLAETSTANGLPSAGSSDLEGRQHDEDARPFTQYTVEQTCELLQRLGLQNVDAFRENAIMGGDLLELTQEELRSDLGLTPLQIKKVRNLVAAFDTFESICTTPGRGHISRLELQEWLQRQSRDDEEIQAVATGFKRALGKDALNKIAFFDFATQYQWLIKTLKVMALANDDSVSMSKLSSLNSTDLG